MTLTTSQYRRHAVFAAINVVSGSELVLPAIRRVIVVDNIAGAAALVVRHGSTTVSAPAVASQLLHTTGMTDGLVDVAPAATPSSGNDNFSRVAEITPDSDISYIASATPGDRDLYDIPSLSMTLLATKGLRRTAPARKDDAGDGALSLVLKSGSEVALVSPAGLGSSFAFIHQIQEASCHRRGLDAGRVGRRSGRAGGRPMTRARVTTTAIEVLVEANPNACSIKLNFGQCRPSLLMESFAANPVCASKFLRRLRRRL